MWTEVTVDKTEKTPAWSKGIHTHMVLKHCIAQIKHIWRLSKLTNYAWVTSSAFLMQTSERWDLSLTVTQEWWPWRLRFSVYPQTILSPESDYRCWSEKEQPDPQEWPISLLPLFSFMVSYLFNYSFLSYLISFCCKVQHLKNTEKQKGEMSPIVISLSTHTQFWFSSGMHSHLH